MYFVKLKPQVKLFWDFRYNFGIIYGICIYLVDFKFSMPTVVPEICCQWVIIRFFQCDDNTWLISWPGISDDKCNCEYEFNFLVVPDTVRCLVKFEVVNVCLICVWFLKFGVVDGCL